jgi:predicted nucleic acid-binding protein
MVHADLHGSIAAHALRHGARLATADNDFMNAQFPRLKILQP